MPGYRFSMTRVFPYKDKIRVMEKPYSSTFYVMALHIFHLLQVNDQKSTRKFAL